MASPTEYLDLHAQVRQASRNDIMGSFQTALEQGMRIEDLVVVLMHVDEALMPDERKEDLQKNGIQSGCMIVNRQNYADAIRDVVHPLTGAKCYEKLADAMQSQLQDHFFVAVFHSPVSSLTKVRVTRS